MLDYAAGDTSHLIALARHPGSEAEGKGRWSWAEEEFELLTDAPFNAPNEEPLFLRLKGAKMLKPPSWPSARSACLARIRRGAARTGHRS
jgi:ribonuclease D